MTISANRQGEKKKKTKRRFKEFAINKNDFTAGCGRLLNLQHHCCVSISVPSVHPNEAKAGSQASLNKPGDETLPWPCY